MNDSTKDTLYKVLIDCNKRDGVVDFFMNIRLLMSQRLLFTGVLFLLSSTWVSPVVTQDLLFSGKHQKRWFEIKLTWPLDWLVPLLKWMGWLDHYVLFQPKIIKKKNKKHLFYSVYTIKVKWMEGHKEDDWNNLLRGGHTKKKET